MPDDEPILAACHVAKQVNSPDGILTIVDDVDFVVAPGESMAIMGPSGAGKSTLLAMLAGLETPSSGQVMMFGENLAALDEDGRAAVRSQRVGFVFQSFHLIPSLTALENVMLPLELAGVQGAHARAQEALGHVGLTARATHYPRQLSGGEQQRVAIARAFVTRPKLLFADEPTGNLDRATGGRVIDFLFNANAAAGTTLILVTHDAALAARCQRILALDGGRVVAS